MMLADKENNLECIINSENLNFIIIEKTEYFEKFINDIYNQISKIDDTLILYNDEFDVIDMNKHCDVIFSPRDIVFSQNNKINKKLISYLKEIIFDDEIDERFIQNHSQLVNILDEVKDLSDYQFTFEDEYSLEQILKNNAVKLKEPTGNFLERLIEYIKINRDFLDIDIFFIVGCKIYLNESDYNHLRKWAMYQDIICILVERDDIYIPKNSNKYILDRDICIIH